MGSRLPCLPPGGFCRCLRVFIVRADPDAAAGCVVSVPGTQQGLPGSAKLGRPAAGARARGCAEPTLAFPPPRSILSPGDNHL